MTAREGRRDDQQPAAGRPHAARSSCGDSPGPKGRAGRVAVVGAGGFIGSALAERLGRAGAEVLLYTRGDPVVGEAGILSAEADTWRTVFWLASSVNPAVAEKRADLIAADQALFEKFLAAARRSGVVARIVLLSSGGTVYDSATAPPYTEASPVRPVTEYGRAKLALEAALDGCDNRPGNAIALRVSNAYGPGQRARRGQGVVAHWLQSAARGEPLVLLGDGRTVRDFVYIDDLVDALVAVDQHVGDLPRVLNIGSGIPTSLAELAKTVLDVVGDPRLEFRSEAPREFDLRQTWLDVTLARDVLEWWPATTLRTGIQAAWVDLRQEDGEGDTLAAGRQERRHP